MLPVTELPKFILFATHERYDPKTDTLQLFRRRVNSEINEVTPYVVRDGVSLRSLFVSEMKRGSKLPELKLFYDILYGYTSEQLNSLTIRTCEIYDGPCQRKQRIRLPMKESDPIDRIGDYIRENIQNYGASRYLLDDDGLVRPLEPGTTVESYQVIRFDVIPEDQQHMRDGEFLVIMKVCRASKHRDKPVDMKSSFLFRVVPGEVSDVTCQRIVGTGFADSRLAPYLAFIAPSGRILNGDECLSDFVNAYDIVQVLLPDRAREKPRSREQRLPRAA